MISHTVIRKKKMTLKTKSRELRTALEAIISGLERYDKDDRSRYTKELAASLTPSVSRLKKAIEEKNREEAKDALADISEVMYEVNGAATKGEIDFISSKILNTYWDLKTIFQELRYRDEDL